MPLVPYTFFPKATDAIITLVVVTLLALLVFGYGKGHFTGHKPITSALQTCFIGAIASAAAFVLAKREDGQIGVGMMMILTVKTKRT